MSLTVAHTVFCDGITGVEDHADGCPRWAVETTEGAREARRLARMNGWVRGVGRGDLSPECARAAELNTMGLNTAPPGVASGA